LCEFQIRRKSIHDKVSLKIKSLWPAVSLFSMLKRDTAGQRRREKFRKKLISRRK